MGSLPSLLSLLALLPAALAYDEGDRYHHRPPQQPFYVNSVKIGVPIGIAIGGLVVVGILLFLVYHFFVQKLIAEKRGGGSYARQPPPPSAMYKNGGPQFQPQPDYYQQQVTQSANSYSYDKEPVALDRTSNASFHSSGLEPLAVPTMAGEPYHHQSNNRVVVTKTSREAYIGSSV